MICSSPSSPLPEVALCDLPRPTHRLSFSQEEQMHGIARATRPQCDAFDAMAEKETVHYLFRGRIGSKVLEPSAVVFLQHYAFSGRQAGVPSGDIFGLDNNVVHPKVCLRAR